MPVTPLGSMLSKGSPRW